MALLLLLSTLSTLRLYSVMITSFHCYGILPEVQALVIKWCKRYKRQGPPCLRISAGMPSGPTALLFFSCFTTLHTSWKDGQASSLVRGEGCGSLSSREQWTGLMQLSNSLRHSSHCGKISLPSLNRVKPFFDLTGSEWCVGPQTSLMAA